MSTASSARVSAASSIVSASASSKISTASTTGVSTSASSKVSTGASPTSVTLAVALFLTLVFTRFFTQFRAQETACSSAQTTSGQGIYTRTLALVITGRSIIVWRIPLVIWWLLIWLLVDRRTGIPSTAKTPAKEDTKEQDCAHYYQANNTKGCKQA